MLAILLPGNSKKTRETKTPGKKELSQSMRFPATLFSMEETLKGNICSIAGIETLDGEAPLQHHYVDRAASPPAWLGQPVGCGCVVVLLSLVLAFLVIF